MAYERVNWVDSEETPLNATNLNKMDKGIEQAHNGDNVPKFTSVDALDSKEVPLEWTEMDVLVTGEKTNFILTKISQMFKNVRYLGKMFEKLNKIFSNTYNLTTTATAGENWAVNDVTAILVGDNLRCYFNASRSPVISEDGDITNETVLSFAIQHGGKIKAVYNSVICSNSVGGVATFYLNNLVVGDTELTFDVNIAAIYDAYIRTNAYFVCPVRLNIDAY